MITIKQITAAWRERHLPECVKAVLRNTGQAALNIKLGRMAFFFLLFSLVKPQGISHSALRHRASASFNKHLFSGQAWGLGDSGRAQCSGISIPVGAGFFWTSLPPVTATYTNSWQEDSVFPSFSPTTVIPPSAPPQTQVPSLSTSHLPAYFHPLTPLNFSLPVGIPTVHHSSQELQEGVWKHTVCGELLIIRIFYYAMSLIPLVQPVEMGGEHFLQRFKVPCFDNKARHQNTKKKINAKGDTNVTADLGISCISDKVRTLRGFPECCFSPPKSGLRSLSTERGSEETPQDSASRCWWS